MNRLHEEVAYIAVHLAWGHEEILSLTHMERLQWVRTINRMKGKQVGL